MTLEASVASDMAERLADYGEYRDHPFVKTLPPATDYLTYLTIIEYNLDKDSLPLLLRLLQEDERLTTNVGWDLVQLLLPLLPDSAPCLETVARRGNPREVVIKVNEVLENLGHEAADVAAAADEADEADAYKDDLQHVNGAPGVAGRVIDQSEASMAVETRCSQFKQLLKMVGMLHPRIKTKRPSRFLVTTIESVLSGFRGLGRDVLLWGVTDSMLDLLEDLSVITRPPLPPRAGSHAAGASVNLSADDPEAEPVDVEEAALQHKVLVSFATRIFELLVVQSRLGFPPDVVTWTSRYMDVEFPGRLPWPRDAASSRPDEEAIQSSSQHEKRLLNILAGKLGVRREKLGMLVGCVDHQEATTRLSSEELPVSLSGSLMLLASAEFDRIMHGVQTTSQFGPSDHRVVVETYLAGPDDLDLGPNSLTVIDAILMLGWAWTGEDKLPFLFRSSSDAGRRQDGVSSEVGQDAYNGYLQHLSLVAANAPSPVLRYQAHALVTRLIQGTKDTGLRLGFIQDTLEFCPFGNLKVTAVGWFKDETLTAFGKASALHVAQDGGHLFTRPETLRKVAMALFEPPGLDQDDDENGNDMASKIPFWMASLNLLYLLCANKDIRTGLAVEETIRAQQVGETFVEPLASLAAQMLDELAKTVPEFQEGMPLSDAALLDDAVTRARDGLSILSSSLC